MSAGPELPEPLPPDPRSIGVWPGFVAGCRAFARLFVPLTFAYAALLLPLMLLFGLSAPTLSAAMLGRPLETLPATREWFGFLGVMLLAWLGGGLGSIAVEIAADRELDGGRAPRAAELANRVLERLLPVVGAWLLYFLVVVLPVLLPIGAAMAGSLLGRSPDGADGPDGLAVPFLFFMLLVLFPWMMISAMYLRFGPVLSAVRDRPPRPALRESFALVRGRWWRTFGFAALVALVVQAAATGGMLAGLVGHMLHPLLGPVLYGLALAVCLPFQLVQEVAILRRLELVRQREPAVAATADGPFEEPGSGPAPPPPA
jgi:hypothetical protein